MISIEQEYDTLKISFFDENGDNKILKAKIPESQLFNWANCNGDPVLTPFPGKMSQYKQPVYKKKGTYLNKYRQREVMDKFPQHWKDMIHSRNKPRKFFMDIETEVIDAFPDVNVGREKIVSNSWCDEFYNGTVTGLKPLTLEQQDRLQQRVNDYFKKDGHEYKITFKYYESEVLMMSDLMYHEVPKMPWISGWNFLKFDWAYINRRCKNIGVDYTRASPTGSMEHMSFKDKYDKSKKWKVELPKHRAIVDYQMVYEKWDTVVKFKENASLDAVAKEVLGYEKVKYPGSLSDFYENDYEGFIFYNMVDTILVSLIDKKIATFNTMFAIANGAGIQLNDAQFTSVGVEAKLQKEFTDKNIVLVPRVKDENTGHEESYSGGYVYEPQIGIFEHAYILDFASMFPSILMAFNIGTDSFVGMYDEEVKKIFTYSKEYVEYDPNIHIKSASKAVYDKTEDSSLRCFIANTINERLEAKLASAEIENDIKTLEEVLETM